MRNSALERNYRAQRDPMFRGDKLVMLPAWDALKKAREALRVSDNALPSANENHAYDAAAFLLDAVGVAREAVQLFTARRDYLNSLKKD